MCCLLVGNWNYIQNIDDASPRSIKWEPEIHRIWFVLKNETLDTNRMDLNSRNLGDGFVKIVSTCLGENEVLIFKLKYILNTHKENICKAWLRLFILKYLNAGRIYLSISNIVQLVRIIFCETIFIAEKVLDMCVSTYMRLSSGPLKSKNQ
jgi:hypothetical protein